MKLFLLRFFTWWNGATIGTLWHTRRHGALVGRDEFGNAYYRDINGVSPTLGFERRWVVFNGEAEASAVPPGWFGWLHHTVDVPPTEEAYTPREWQKPHFSNPSGTAAAIRPSGSLLRGGKRQQNDGDYEAWSPGP